MNRFRRITLAGLAALFATPAFARRGRGGDHHGSMDPARLDERIERMVKHFGVEVDATPEQQQKLAAIAKQAARDLQPYRGQARDLRRQGIELLSREKVDRAAIESLRVAKLQQADAASRRFSQALADAAEVLTPEQRKKAAAHAARMGRGRHRHWS